MLVWRTGNDGRDQLLRGKQPLYSYALVSGNSSVPSYSPVNTHLLLNGRKASELLSLLEGLLAPVLVHCPGSLSIASGEHRLLS